MQRTRHHESLSVRYEFEPYDGTPGDDYRRFARNLLNAGAATTDDRGYSLADLYMGIDEGGDAGTAPAMPAATSPAELRKAMLARAKRLKEGYSLLVKHVTDEDHKTNMQTHAFQNGRHAYQYMETCCARPMDKLTLSEMNTTWHNLSILAEVGVSEHSIKDYAKRLRVINGLRPPGEVHDETELTEKLLQSIYKASKFFTESAMKEFNAVPGQREYQHPAGHPLAGQRDFNACVVAYDALWKQAVLAGK